MSRSYSFDSRNSHLDLPKPANFDLEETLGRSLSSPPSRNQSCEGIDTDQNHPHNPGGVGTTEPQPLLMNDWVLMKIEVPKVYMGIIYTNMLASIFTWLLLAGFIVLPVTFASLRSSRAANVLGKAGTAVFSTVENIPFLVLAGVCFLFGVVGLSWLWWENRKNYIWLIDRVFLPAFLNSLIGLITTIINVYASQSGHWSVTAVVTAAVTAVISIVSVTLYVFYAICIKPVWEEHRKINALYVR